MMLQEQLAEFSAFVGLDWADKKHDLCVQRQGLKERTFDVIESSPEAINRWFQELHQSCQGRIAVAVELDKGPVVYALHELEFVSIFPVNPTTLARYRSAFKPSMAKNDASDAEFILDLFLRYPEKHPPLVQETSDIRALALLVKARRTFVDERRRLTNRLISSLKEYYPQVLDWFAHRDTDLFCDFVIRWPCLQTLQSAPRRTVRYFFSKHAGRAAPLTEERIQAIYSAQPLTSDWAIISAMTLQSMALACQIRQLSKAIRIYDSQIQELFQNHGDHELFSKLPGAGPCLSPRLLVAFGDDRARFENAQQVQQYAGIAPVTQKSGKKCWIHFRWQCSKFVRQTFVEWAAKTVRLSGWATAYYQKQRQRGKDHQVAVRALAYKWIRILFRCWQNREPYDEARYQARLLEHGTDLDLMT